MGPAAGSTPSQGAAACSAQGGASYLRGRRPPYPHSALRRLGHGARHGGSWDSLATGVDGAASSGELFDQAGFAHGARFCGSCAELAAAASGCGAGYWVDGAARSGDPIGQRGGARFAAAAAPPGIQGARALRRLLDPAAGPTPSRRGATVCSAGGGAACCSRCPPGTEINNHHHHRVLRGTLRLPAEVHRHRRRGRLRRQQVTNDIAAHRGSICISCI